MRAAHRRVGHWLPIGCSESSSASLARAAQRPLMCTSNLPPDRARPNRQRARAPARESRRRRERRPRRAQVWAPAQRTEPALRPRVGEWAPALGREVGRSGGGLELEEKEMGRTAGGGRRPRQARGEGVGAAPKFGDISGSAGESKGLIEGGWWFDHRRGFRSGLCRRRRRRGDRRRGWSGCSGLARSAPVRLGLLVLRWGSRPDRGGESASGSTSDSSRHVAYPGLPARPGQGNCDVSRETIAQNVRSRGYTVGQRA